MTGEWQSSACILCECNCGIVVQVDGRNLAKIRGDKDHPASQGYTCNKALRLDHYQNNGNRLTSPMRRRPDGGYEEIDWDTAISEIASGFKRIAGLTPALASYSSFATLAEEFRARRRTAMVANILRHAHELRATRVVVLTGFEHRTELRRALASKADEHGFVLRDVRDY